MKVTLEGYFCIVEKEPGDPVFKYSGWSHPESTFLYHVKKALTAQGFDLIKKRMWKDGHMVDENLQFLRTRSWKKDGDFFIYNNMYCLYDAGLEFNDTGKVILNVVYWQDL